MSIARRTSLYILLPCALRACLFILLNLSFLRSAVLCQSTAHLDDASPEVAFTPPVCLHGRSVDLDQLPASCDNTWFIVSGKQNETSHVTRSSSSRAILQFNAVAISWFSSPVTYTRGTADVFVDDIHLDRVQLSPDNTAINTPAWSTTGLDPHITHNLTIVPLGDDIIIVDSFILTPYQNTFPDVSLISAANPDRGPAQKDGSSGTVISLASIGAVALVVALCGGCFFLGKRRRSPGFHMPTVLVDIENELDDSDPPSPTTIRAWRESTHKSLAVAAAAGEPTHDQYPPTGASGSRPPSYRSTKDSLYRSESSSQSHQGHSGWR